MHVATVKTKCTRFASLIDCASMSPPTLIPPLDIFKIYRKGQESWLGPAEDVLEALLRLKRFGQGRYMVLNPKTGTKLFYEVDKNGELNNAAAV